MNRTLSTWLAAVVIAAGLSQAAPAQTINAPDWTQSVEYRTTVTPLHLDPAKSGELQTVIRTQSGEFGPIFMRERSDLVNILTPEQLVIYDEMFSPQYYYSYGLFTPEDWVNYRQRMVTRLNLTPQQQTRFIEIVGRTDTDLRPIVTRYETRYATVLTPEQWVAFRTGATGRFVTVQSAGSSESSASSASSSVQTEEYRRVYRETTVQTAPAERPMPAAAPAAPVKQTRALNWRNQDLK